MKILAIDPGSKRCGYALFDDGKLIDCGIVSTKKKDVVAGAFEMALGLPHGVDVLAVERMRIYRPRPGQNVQKLPNPEHLINISTVSGIIIGCVTAKDEKYYMPYANEWKKSLPKDISNDIISVLVPESTKILDKNKVAQSHRNHSLDACGIGLWAINETKAKKGK